MSKEMLEAFKEFEAQSKRHRCLTCSLKPDLLDTVDTLIEQGRSCSLLEAWLASLGISVSTDSLRAHKRRRHIERRSQQR